MVGRRDHLGRRAGHQPPRRPFRLRHSERRRVGFGPKPRGAGGLHPRYGGDAHDERRRGGQAVVPEQQQAQHGVGWATDGDITASRTSNGTTYGTTFASRVTTKTSGSCMLVNVKPAIIGALWTGSMIVAVGCPPRRVEDPSKRSEDLPPHARIEVPTSHCSGKLAVGPTRPCVLPTGEDVLPMEPYFAGHEGGAPRGAPYTCLLSRHEGAYLWYIEYPRYFQGPSMCEWQGCQSPVLLVDPTASAQSPSVGDSSSGLRIVEGFEPTDAGCTAQ